MDTPDPLDKPRHTIRVVARRTGLTPATLRAWERRYNAVQPARSDTERRLYRDADIERLRLMRALAAQGHSVGQLAELSTTELMDLEQVEAVSATGAGNVAASSARGASAPTATETAAVLASCERAVMMLDAAELYRLLIRSMVELGPDNFINQTAVPLCHRIGFLWERGKLTVSHEHVASVALRQALDFLFDKLRDGTAGPHLVSTTPAGERHEFGAMMAGIVARSAGWAVTYLGPDLPAADVAAAVRQSGARVVALSIVSVFDSRGIEGELLQLREAVGPRVAIIAGGAAAESYAEALSEIGAHRLEEFVSLRSLLTRLGDPLPATAR